MSGSQDEARPAQPAPSGVFERLASRPSVEGRLREESEIARGGMGAILRVWDDDLRRTLAMKVSLARPGAKGEAGTASTDERLLHRFLEEAQITGQLEHPGIVPVHELGVDARGRLFFTMPLVRGATLEQVFEHEKRGADGWSRTRALGVLLRVCEAVAFAHGKGVVHRDLKPANVMVGRFGETYVMDWGLARVLGTVDRRDLRLAVDETMRSLVHTERADGRTPDSPLATMDGDVVGTPCYMAPEQARGEIEAVGPRSDVYSIGAMLYQLLAGHAPYLESGAPKAPLDVLRRLHDGAPAPIESLSRGVPEELIAICGKAMARSSSARYASAAELAEDLRAYLEDRVVRAHASGPVAEFRKWFARNRAAALAGSAAVVVAAAGLIATVLIQADANERLQAAGDEAREARDAALSANTALETANLELAAARWSAASTPPTWPRPRPACGWATWSRRARAWRPARRLFAPGNGAICGAAPIRSRAPCGRAGPRRCASRCTPRANSWPCSSKRARCACCASPTAPSRASSRRRTRPMGRWPSRPMARC